MDKSRKQKPRPETGENRLSEGLTVVWMMSVMTTLLCGLAAAIVLLAAHEQADGVQLFGRLLHFSAFVSAVLSLLLLAAVLKFREQPPPPAITWSSVAIALTAIATALLY